MLTRFVTTTVAAEATLRPASPSSNQPIPVAAIAGGVVGGALLAVLVTASWIWWGKLIKRKQLADRLENVGVFMPRIWRPSSHLNPGITNTHSQKYPP